MRAATPALTVSAHLDAVDHERLPLHRLADAAGERHRAGARHVGQEQAELLAAVADEDVLLAQLVAHDVGEAPQHAVAGEVAVACRSRS